MYDRLSLIEVERDLMSSGLSLALLLSTSVRRSETSKVRAHHLRFALHSRDESVLW